MEHGPIFRSFGEPSAAYWLANCHGFQVSSPSGRVGVVKDVLFTERTDRPDYLVVHGGIFRKREVLVDVDSITEVRPRERRVIINRADPWDREGPKAPG